MKRSEKRLLLRPLVVSGRRRRRRRQHAMTSPTCMSTNPARIGITLGSQGILLIHLGTAIVFSDAKSVYLRGIVFSCSYRTDGCLPFLHLNPTAKLYNTRIIQYFVFLRFFVRVFALEADGRCLKQFFLVFFDDGLRSIAPRSCSVNVLNFSGFGFVVLTAHRHIFVLLFR